MTYMPSPVSTSIATIVPKKSQYRVITLITATVTTILAFATLAVTFSDWPICLAWFGYSNSKKTTREGYADLMSFALGLLCATGPPIFVGFFALLLELAVAQIVIFIDVIVVLCLYALLTISNTVAYLLDMISCFASAITPSEWSLVIPAVVGLIGLLGAAIAHLLQTRRSAADDFGVRRGHRYKKMSRHSP